MLPKDRRIESRGTRYGKLMHPKGRLRRRWSVPAHTLSIKEVDIPRWSALDSYDARIRLAERFVGIPVVARARIRDQPHSIFDVGLARSQLRNPNEEGSEILSGDFRENILLNFERPPKTVWSSRANKHDDAYAIAGSIESSAERLAVIAQHLVTGIGGSGSGATTQCDRSPATAQERLARQLVHSCVTPYKA